DCLSHRGIAKELSAILKLPLTHDPLSNPPAGGPDLSQTTNDLHVLIDDATLCPRYVAGLIKGVKVGSSPEWLKTRLEAVGQRSINNVVDATNFVMLNIGQPLHAFDARELMSRDQVHVISVRRARSGERLVALDQKEYVLADSMLAIVDANADVPIGIAGVKGGSPASITESTTDIILESANFNGPSVRKTAQGLKLRTDASARFEQGLSPELAGYGMRAAIDFILELAGGEFQGVVDVYPAAQQETKVSVSLEKINEVLGTSLTEAEITDAFTRLGLTLDLRNPNIWEVRVPFERLDLTTAEDLVEEVGRIVGYEKIPAVPLPSINKTPEVTANFAVTETVREELVNKGYSEVYTSVFSEAGERAVLNKVDSVKPFLRASLISGLTEAMEKNKQQRELLGLKEIKLFEIGPVWKEGKELVMVGTVSEKEATKETLLEVKDNTLPANLLLSQATRYQPFSRYPYIVRDVAMWTPAGTDENAVLETIKQEAGELAHKVWLFDRFEKQGKVSLAYRLIFQSFERTLTEEEANKAMEKVSEKLNTMGFEIR
ncbi:MAG: phenylalanine--tRNA ligase subunit beta, partial [Patescibacteria group bacterium]|nr:phenylalanine--tRNA ligase subunit beta [Patescibacteria group bacterium]